MSLSFITDNTLFRQHSVKNIYKNILYEPKDSIIDHLFFLTQDNYFIVNNKSYTNIDNIVCIPDNHLLFHNYNLIISHSLEKHINSDISFAMHTPLLLVLDYIKSYKKEDKFLIQQKTQQYIKIFLNKESYNDYDKHNSYYLNIGIPLDVFNSKLLFTDRSDVCVIGNSILSQQLKTAINQNGKTCDIIDISGSVDNISNIFNKYKICIDLSNNYWTNLLVASACGCFCITSNTNKIIDQEIIVYSDIGSSLISTIHSLLEIIPNTSDNRNFIYQKYPFEPFIKTLSGIIKHNSHEAFIL